MMFFLPTRAAALLAAALFAGAAAAAPQQAANCSRAAAGGACDKAAALDMAAARQGEPAALYQDLLTPLENDAYANARDSAELVRAPAKAAPPAAPVIPVPEQRPYTMLLVGLGLLIFKSRKKRTEKFSA